MGSMGGAAMVDLSSNGTQSSKLVLHTPAHSSARLDF